MSQNIFLNQKNKQTNKSKKNPTQWQKHKFWCFKEFDIWYIQGVSEKLISFCNLISWPILVRMISNFNCLCRNNSKFSASYLNAFSFPVISVPEKKKIPQNIELKILSCFSHAIKIWDHLCSLDLVFQSVGAVEYTDCISTKG